MVSHPVHLSALGWATRPLQEQRKELPIFQLRPQLMNAIQEHQILVIIGETGSGVVGANQRNGMILLHTHKN